MYQAVDVGNRPPAPPVDPGDPAVKTFELSLGTMPEIERAERMRILAEFCGFVSETPAQMIDSIFDRDAYRYVRRNYFSERILEFSSTVPGDWDDRKAVGDVVREFFRANGHTIAPVVPSWHLWLRMG